MGSLNIKSINYQDATVRRSAYAINLEISTDQLLVKKFKDVFSFENPDRLNNFDNNARRSTEVISRLKSSKKLLLNSANTLKNLGKTQISDILTKQAKRLDATITDVTKIRDTLMQNAYVYTPGKKSPDVVKMVKNLNIELYTDEGRQFINSSPQVIRCNKNKHLFPPNACGATSAG